MAIGTYYVCDNFPVAEGMRKREVQYKEDMRREAEMIKEERRLKREQAEEKRLMARRNAEEEERPAKEEVTKREDKRIEKTEREPTPPRPSTGGELANHASQGKLPVTIKGVSINLPFEELRQKFSAMLGGTISESDSVLRLCESLYGDWQNQFEPFSLGVSGALWIKDDPEIKLLFKTLKLTDKPKRLLFKDRVAFGGSLFLTTDCCYVEFSESEGGASKYIHALAKKYPVIEGSDIYVIKQIGDYAEVGSSRYLLSVYAYAGSDGIIFKSNLSRDDFGLGTIKTKTIIPDTFYYFGKSVLDKYNNDYLPQKKQRDREKRQLEEQEKQRKQREAKEKEERIRKRDSEI